MPTVSGSVSPVQENCGASQAVCTLGTFCAPHSPKLRDVSGFLHQALCTSPRENWGTSQALCSPVMNIADSLRLCAPPARKLWDVSGSVHPREGDAVSRRIKNTPTLRPFLRVAVRETLRAFTPNRTNLSPFPAIEERARERERGRESARERAHERERESARASERARARARSRAS